MFRKIIAIASIFVCIALPATATAALYNPLGGVCNTGSSDFKDAKQSSACNANTTTLTGKNSVFKKASTIVATIAGIAAVIVILVGGLQYTVSNGDSQKTANARSAIIGGAIGLGIIVAAQGIILLVLSRLQ